MQLSSDGTKEELQKLFDMYFQYNAKLDAIVYAMQNKFNLIKFANRVHVLSHQCPLYADMIQDFADERGLLFYRNSLIKEDSYRYNSPIECMQDAFNYSLEIEKQLKKVIHTAIDNDDLMIEDFTRDFSITTQAPFTHQWDKYLQAMKDYDEDNVFILFNSEFSSFNTILKEQNSL